MRSSPAGGSLGPASAAEGGRGSVPAPGDSCWRLAFGGWPAFEGASGEGLPASPHGCEFFVCWQDWPPEHTVRAVGLGLRMQREGERRSGRVPCAA